VDVRAPPIISFVDDIASLNRMWDDTTSNWDGVSPWSADTSRLLEGGVQEFKKERQALDGRPMVGNQGQMVQVEGE